MLPAKIPQLDNMFVQALCAEDIRKKPLQHLVTALTLMVNKNVQRFNDI